MDDKERALLRAADEVISNAKVEVADIEKCRDATWHVGSNKRHAPNDIVHECSLCGSQTYLHDMPGPFAKVLCVSCFLEKISQDKDATLVTTDLGGKLIDANRAIKAMIHALAKGGGDAPN